MEGKAGITWASRDRLVLGELPQVWVLHVGLARGRESASVKGTGQRGLSYELSPYSHQGKWDFSRQDLKDRWLRIGSCVRDRLTHSQVSLGNSPGSCRTGEAE